MKAFEVNKPFGIDNLRLVERKDPVPGPGQVLVKVKAVSLNFRDLLTVKHGALGNIRLPLIPLSDGAGEVEKVGEGVTRVQPGDRVAGIFFQTWLTGDITATYFQSALGGTADGMLAEQVVLHQEGVVRIPDYMSYEEAATLPCAAVTAWQALVSKGSLKAGDTVLVLGTGGVSIFALQFAMMHGARVIITSSSDEKLARAKQIGAAEVINYKTTPAWDKHVLELTGGVGVDHVEEVGGAGTLEKSLQAVRIGGMVSLIGILGGLGGQINPVPVLMKGVRMQGIYVGSREMFEDMNRAMAINKVHPVIDKVFPFTETRAALQYMESAAHFGKIVIAL
ncbi:MAG: zinc-dependent alcohol dehydrogenase family protein [Candidatus Binatia bacterium]